MKNIVIVKLLFLTLLSNCEKAQLVQVVEYKITDCNNSESYDDLMSYKNRIRNAYWEGDLLVLDVFFVENCGFAIDPAVSIEADTLLIEADRFRLDSIRISILCTCCYVLELRMSGFTGVDLSKLVYQLQLSGEYPERIFRTDSLNHSYSIDYIIFEGDTLHFPPIGEWSIERVFDGYTSDSTWIKACFPDNADLTLRKYDPQTEKMCYIKNGRYSIRDSTNTVVEMGFVKYRTLNYGKGRAVKLIPR